MAWSMAAQSSDAHAHHAGRGREEGGTPGFMRRPTQQASMRQGATLTACLPRPPRCCPSRVTEIWHILRRRLWLLLDDPSSSGLVCAASSGARVSWRQGAAPSGPCTGTRHIPVHHGAHSHLMHNLRCGDAAVLPREPLPCLVCARRGVTSRKRSEATQDPLRRRRPPQGPH